jgi:hypothetical protein
MLPRPAAAIRVGDPAPEFAAPLADANGTTHTMAQYRGSVVLLGLIGYS